MEWYSKFNSTNAGNNSVYTDGRFGVWANSEYELKAIGTAALYGVGTPDIISVVFREIFKSSLVTLISLYGVTRLKSTSVKTALQRLLEGCCVVILASAFYTLMLAFLAPFAIYRLLVLGYFTLFRSKCTLMHGTDAFWCMDTDEARSIINILIILETTASEDNLLETLTEQMIKLCRDPIYGKKFISLRCKSRLGYYYWEKGHISNAKNNINYIENTIKNKNDINYFLSTISNKEIDGFGWEIYVSRNNLENSKLRPVIFRMHHSIGDGSSILQALINTISDKINSRITLSQAINVSFQPKGTNLKMTSPKSEPFSVRKNKFIHSLKLNVSKIPLFIYGPLNLIRQLYDDNQISNLSVSKLSGNKIVTWCNDEETLKHLKTIKKKTNSTFSEVVFTLFSICLWKYFERQKTQVPDYINVVVPIFGDRKHLKVTSEIINEGKNIKISKISEINQGMSNGFWVALLKLPVNSYNAYKSFESTLRLVRESTDRFRKSPDFVMYSFMISVIVTLVPGYLAKPMFNVAKTHLVFSNLPGPQDTVVIAGRKVAQMNFWLPNRATTGLGLSLLSNNNRLSVGLLADTAVIPTQRDLQSILDDFINIVSKESV